MKRTILILAIAAVLIGAQEAYACTCVDESTPCRAFSEAKAIFVGKAIGASQQKEETDQDGDRILYDVGAIRFSIVEAFLGVREAETVIHSGTGGGDCGYWFEHGKTYLVYAYGEKEQLYTSMCTRTRPIDKAEEDLSFLRNLPARGAGGTLYGTVSKVLGDIEHGPVDLIAPMAGIKVLIEGERRRFEAVTNEEGEYRKSGLPPGSYDVTLELPNNLKGFSQYGRNNRFGHYFSNEKVKISDRGCVRNSFTVQSDGRIGGRVTSGDGNPVKEMRIDLVNADSTEIGWSATTDAQGYYEFRMVQPGRYLFGVSLYWVPNAECPYPRTYFPGVSDQLQARIIGVGDGTRLQGYNIILPPRLAERTVEGVVVWPNGSPGVKAYVTYELSEYPGNSMPRIVELDGKGGFSVSLFEGHKYTLYAEFNRGGKPVHSEPIELTPGAKTENIKLVLNKQGYGFVNSRDYRKRMANMLR